MHALHRRKIHPWNTGTHLLICRGAAPACLLSFLGRVLLLLLLLWVLHDYDESTVAICSLVLERVSASKWVSTDPWRRRWQSV